MPKSHLYFKEATSHIKTDFKKLTEDNWILNDDYYVKLLVTMNEGDLLIWDGRTVHCNTYQLKGNGNTINNEYFLKMVSYITYSLKDKVNYNDKDKNEYYKYRLKAYRNYTTTGHWPYKVNIVNELNENELNDIGINKFELMNDIVKSLIGWNGNKPNWYM